MIKIVVKGVNGDKILETSKLLDLVTYIAGLNGIGGRVLDVRIYSGSKKIYGQLFNSIYIKHDESLIEFIRDLAEVVLPHSSQAVDDLKNELEDLRKAEQ